MSARVLVQVPLALLVAACATPAVDTVGSDDPPRVVHTNDGNLDVYTLEYLMALGSAGKIRLLGIVADAGTGYRLRAYEKPKVWEEGRRQYADIVSKARHSGMVRLPDPVAGAHWALEAPVSGRIEDTRPLDTPGSRLIRDLARESTAEDPLLVVTGGPLTAVADAYLLDPAIAERMVVKSLLGRQQDMADYNGQIDGWAAYIVLEKLRYEQFPVDQGLPRVPKSRLRGSEIPDCELKRFMVDKFQQLPPLHLDGDVPPAISVVVAGYVRRAKHVAFGGWVPVKTWGNGHPQVPQFKDDPQGRALVVTAASATRGTQEWWRALSDPDAYREPVSQQTPFSGEPRVVPGKIEAEEFDWGGEGHAYHDIEFNGWVDHRTVDAVDLAVTGDAGGGLKVTRVVEGEWLEYTVHASQAGEYAFVARAASSEGGGRFHIRVDGADATDPITVPKTDGSDRWTSLPARHVRLAPGTHVLRLEFDRGGFELNYLQVLPAGP